MAKKWPIDLIDVHGIKISSFSQIEPDLGGIQVGLNFEVTAQGYLVTRDWTQERDSPDELSLYAKESRTMIEKFYFDAAGDMVAKIAQSTEWEPVKESRRLQIDNIRQPESRDHKGFGPIMQPMTGAPPEAFNG